jgi:hypothetical protein
MSIFFAGCAFYLINKMQTLFLIGAAIYESRPARPSLC